MAWKTKKLQELEQVFKADDTLDHDWSITRRVDEEAVPPKQYARELCRTKHYIKDGVAETFTITLTLADVRWIMANAAKIEAALKPTPKATKPAATPAADAPGDIEEVPF